MKQVTTRNRIVRQLPTPKCLRASFGSWPSAGRWALGVVAVASLVSATIAAQQAPPVFRSATSIVSVDVIVRDASGNVIKGLTGADFTVLEDGKPQQIETFSFQQIT